MPNDKRKQSLYFPEDMLNEIQAEATRQDRSISWVVQQAWRLSRDEMSKLPNAERYVPKTQAEAFAQGKFDTGA